VFQHAQLQTFDDAASICQMYNATLLTVHYEHKQRFLANFLFNISKVANDVWIGARYNSASRRYEWQDGTQVDRAYKWAEMSPKNLPNHCVQLHSNGKWADELCYKKNVVVCQKRPNLSLMYLHEVIRSVKQNLIPVGFIYIQHPKESPPGDIWYWMHWEDVSAAYEGVFFRVEANNKSVEFGQVQEESSPRLVNVTAIHDQGTYVPKPISYMPLGIVPGIWSDQVHTGNLRASNFYASLKFYVSSAEVRPRNMAIRIWKRIG